MDVNKLNDPNVWWDDRETFVIDYDTKIWKIDLLQIDKGTITLRKIRSKE